MKIVFDLLPEEWYQVRQSLKDRFSALDFNSLIKEILLKREGLYIIMGIRRTSRNARKLDPAAKIIMWFDKCELDGPNDDDDVDAIIGDPDYVRTL